MAKVYSIQPVQTSAGGFGTACMMYDMITGKTLSSQGGGGNYISAETMAVLRDDVEVQELIKRKVEEAGRHPVA